jgi:hypothetical protein
MQGNVFSSKNEKRKCQSGVKWEKSGVKWEKKG